VKAIFSPADISQYEAVAAMVEDVEARLGSVDVLVNNAGIQFTFLRLKIFPSKNGSRLLIINLSGCFLRHSRRTLPP
jgi:3-hydroxybutyrate dehydrogenase